MIYAIIIVYFIRFVFVDILPYKNPYTLTFIFGKKGSGKTTDGVRRAVAALRHRQHVYTDIWMDVDTIPNPDYFHHVDDPASLGVTFFPPPESLLILDEVGIVWNNRDFKKFSSKTREWFKLQRQYHVTCVLYSQTWDVDIQIRNLTDNLYICSRIAPSLLMMRRINRRLVVVKPSDNAESRIADELVLTSPLLSLLGAHTIRFLFIPDYIKYYDTDYKVTK